MTAVLDSILRDVLGEIEPTATQKDGAQRSHKHLRDLLKTGQMAARIRNSYLSGSYSRDTAIRPLDDVDIIFEIDPSAWGGGLFLFDSMPPPERVLDSFANAIRYRYPVSSVHTQRRSVRLELNHLDIDIVPAIPERRDPSTIKVPDRESGEWIKSSPQRHSENATRTNKKHKGQVQAAR